MVKKEEEEEDVKMEDFIEWGKWRINVPIQIYIKEA